MLCVYICVYYRDRYLSVNVCPSTVFIDVMSVSRAYMSRVYPAAFQSCDQESRGGGRCMLFLFYFFSFYFCVFSLICSDLHLSYCDLHINIWFHCLVNTTFQGYCYRVDLQIQIFIEEKRKKINKNYTVPLHCP